MARLGQGPDEARDSVGQAADLSPRERFGGDVGNTHNVRGQGSVSGVGLRDERYRLPDPANGEWRTTPICRPADGVSTPDSPSVAHPASPDGLSLDCRAGSYTAGARPPSTTRTWPVM